MKEEKSLSKVVINWYKPTLVNFQSFLILQAILFDFFLHFLL